MSDTRDLGLILDARIPIVVIESPDERRVLALLLQFAMQRGLPFSEWSVTRGCGAANSLATAETTSRSAIRSRRSIHICSTPGSGALRVVRHPSVPHQRTQDDPPASRTSRSTTSSSATRSCWSVTR